MKTKRKVNGNGISVKYFKVPNSVYEFGLNTYQLAVLIYLLKYGERCWPSIPTIAKATGMSTAKAKRSLFELQHDFGFIDWKPGFKGKSNTYTVNLLPFTGPAIQLHESIPIEEVRKSASQPAWKVHQLAHQISSLTTEFWLHFLFNELPFPAEGDDDWCGLDKTLAPWDRYVGVETVRELKNKTVRGDYISLLFTRLPPSGRHRFLQDLQNVKTRIHAEFKKHKVPLSCEEDDFVLFFKENPKYTLEKFDRWHTAELYRREAEAQADDEAA